MLTLKPLTKLITEKVAFFKKISNVRSQNSTFNLTSHSDLPGFKNLAGLNRYHHPTEMTKMPPQTYRKLIPAKPPLSY